jgi:hypothetical protein
MVAAVPALEVEIPTTTVVPALQVKVPTMAVVASSPDLSMGEEVLQADLDTAVGADASRLDPESGQNPAGGDGGHMGGAPAEEGPPLCIEGAWLF